MAQAKAVPDGFTTVTPFLNIKNAGAAIEFYKKAFGAEERQRFAAPNGQIMMCELKIGNSIVRIAEAVNDPPTQSGLQLYVEDADAWFARATAAGAEVIMPLQNMFWGDRFGLVKDAFGNRWTISTHLEDVAPDELQRRGAEAMKQRQYPAR